MALSKVGRSVARAPFQGWVEIAIGRTRRRVGGVDLCTAGIGLQAALDGLGPDDTVVTEFALPGIGLPLALRGVVAWSDEKLQRSGVRFLDIDPGLEELVASYVAGRL